MIRLFFAGLFFLLTACGSGDNEKTASDTMKTTPDTITSLNEGNSAGEDITAIDTLRMDTSSRSISTP